MRHLEWKILPFFNCSHRNTCKNTQKKKKEKKKKYTNTAISAVRSTTQLYSPAGPRLGHLTPHLPLCPPVTPWLPAVTSQLITLKKQKWVWTPTEHLNWYYPVTLLQLRAKRCIQTAAKDGQRLQLHLMLYSPLIFPKAASQTSSRRE